MTSVVVIGGGGHARVVIDILFELGIEVVALVSAGPAEAYRGIPVHIGDAELAVLRATTGSCVVAIGHNGARERLGGVARDLGFELPVVVAPGARVSATASLGDGTVVMNGAVINSGAALGPLCVVNTGASVDHDCELGTAVHVAPGTHLTGTVKVGNRTFLGAGSVVIPEIVIGSDAMVGAGAVVIRDVDARSTVVGNPARTIGSS